MKCTAREIKKREKKNASKNGQISSNFYSKRTFLENVKKGLKSIFKCIMGEKLRENKEIPIFYSFVQKILRETSQNIITQCRNFMIFLSFRFSVKSTSGILEV